MTINDIGNYFLTLLIFGIFIYLLNGLKFNAQMFFNGVACLALLKAIILE